MTSATMTRGWLAGLLLMLSLGVALPAHAAFPGENGRVVSAYPQHDYSCDPEDGGHCPNPRPGPPLIVTNTLRNTARTTLATGTHPTYSATGTRIAYVSEGAIWTMGADGSDKRRVTSPAPGEVDGRPAWAPAGGRLVFQRTSPDGTALHVVRLGDGRVRRLVVGRRPEWSSTDTIAFIRRSEGYRRVHTVTPRGRGLSAVAGTRGATDVSWAPGGRRLGFVKPAKSASRECLVVITPGVAGSRRPLTCRLRGIDGGAVDGLAWAPNGRSLLVAVIDHTDEPENIDGRTLRYFLDGTSRRVIGAALQPDWARRVD